MKIKFILIVLLISTCVSAQEASNTSSNQSKFSIELSYPINISGESQAEMTGYGGLGLRYKFLNKSNFSAGVSFTSDYMRNELPEPLGSYEKGYLFNHLDGIYEFKVPELESLVFFGDVGYTLLYYDTRVFIYDYFGFDPIAPEIDNGRVLHHGFNFKAGIKYNIGSLFYIQTYFHASKIYFNMPSFNKSYIKDSWFSQLKLGFGFNL